jgi:hypothetical protein
MCQPLTKSTGREEYGRSVERRPWFFFSPIEGPNTLENEEN